MSNDVVFETVYIKQECIKDDKSCTETESKTSLTCEPGCFSYQIKQESEELDPEGKELDLYSDYKLKKDPVEAPPCNKNQEFKAFNLYRHHIGKKDIAETQKVCEQFIPPLVALENGKIVRKLRKCETPVDCNICKKTFSTPANLRRHLNIHNGNKRFECDICKKKFTRKCDIIDHLYIHSGTKPFSCNICGKKLGNKPNLNRHLDVHIDRKSYKCNICHKKFKCDLKLHLQTHYKEKPIACSICFEKFTIKADLNFHRRLHSNEKPFTCEICKKKFKDNYNLNRHVRLHSIEKLFPCKICYKTFKRKYAVTRHLQVHTKVEPLSGCKQNDMDKSYRHINAEHKKMMAIDEFKEKCTVFKRIPIVSPTDAFTRTEQLALEKQTSSFGSTIQIRLEPDDDGGVEVS